MADMSILYIAGWLTVAFVIQILLNWISKKINYTYSKKNEMLALLLSVFLWGAILYKWGMNINIFIVCIMISILISIMFIDFKYYEIPNEYNFTLLALGFIYLFINYHNWLSVLMGGIIAFGLFFLIMAITKGSIGGGDVKLSASLGMITGMYLVWEFIAFSFIIGAFVSVVLLLLKKKKKNDKIAFGPYMAMGFILIFLM